MLGCIYMKSRGYQCNGRGKVGQVRMKERGECPERKGIVICK